MKCLASRFIFLTLVALLIVTTRSALAQGPTIPPNYTGPLPPPVLMHPLPAFAPLPRGHSPLGPAPAGQCNTPGNGLLIVTGTTTVFTHSYQQNRPQLENTIAYAYARSRARNNLFAIFQQGDPNPGALPDLRNAITSAGHTYALLDPSTLPTAGLASYDAVILNWEGSNDLTFVPYYTSALPAIENYLLNGGVVWLMTANQGTLADNLPLPFGGVAQKNTQNYDLVLDSTSPMMAGMPSAWGFGPATGSFASFHSFGNLPPQAHLVAGVYQQPPLVPPVPTVYDLNICPPGADLSINKTAPAEVGPGGTISYGIAVTNAGPDSATGAQWSDTLPAHTTFASLSSESGWTCTTPAAGATGAVNCSNASMGVGNAAFTLVVNVDANAAAGTAIHNTASVSANYPDPASGNNSSSASTNVQNLSADLAVTKTATSSVTAGGDLTYTIMLKNNGPTEAAVPVLSDAIVAPVTFKSVTAPAGWTCGTQPAVGSQGALACTLVGPTMPASDQVSFSVVVHVPSNVAAGAQLSNTASVSASSPDPNPANDSSTATTTVAAQAELSLGATSLITGYAGAGVMTYTIKITNLGPSDQSNVTLDSNLPAKLTWTATTADHGGTCAGTTAIHCAWANLAAGQIATATIEATLKPDAQNLQNAVSIGWSGKAAVTTVNDTAPIRAEAHVTMIGKKVGASVVQYTVEMRTDGPSVNWGPSLSDVIDRRTRFSKVLKLIQTDASGKTTTLPKASYNKTAKTLQVALGDLWPGTHITLVFKVALVQRPRTLPNTITLAQTAYDSDPSDNTATVTVQIKK